MEAQPVSVVVTFINQFCLNFGCPQFIFQVLKDCKGKGYRISKTLGAQVHY